MTDEQRKANVKGDVRSLEALLRAMHVTDELGLKGGVTLKPGQCEALSMMVQSFQEDVAQGPRDAIADLCRVLRNTRFLLGGRPEEKRTQTSPLVSNLVWDIDCALALVPGQSVYPPVMPEEKR
jgi:hypothetical protein